MALKTKASFSGVDISEIRKMNALAGPDSINLGIGQLPDDLPISVKAAGIRAFEEGITRYTSNQGMLELRELVAAYHSGRSGKTLTADQVVITNGAEGALWNILYTYLEADDEILIGDFAFSVYDTIPVLQGAKVKTFSFTEDLQPDLEDIRAKVTSSTKFLLINSPANPTGQVISREVITQLCSLAEELDFYIISDEIYSELYYTEEQPVTPLTFSDRVIIVDGISKRAAATGLRIGWTVADTEITKPMVVANQYIASCACSISQYAAIASLNGSTAVFNEEIREDLKEKRDLAYGILKDIEGINVVKPEGSFYIFPEISTFGDSKTVAKRILDEVNVLTIPGLAFGKAGDRHIRISFATDRDDLIEGLERVKKLFQNWSSK